MEIPQSKAKDQSSKYVNKEGLYYSKVKNIENYMKDGQPVISTKGYRAFKVTIQTKQGQLFTDVLYYGDEKVDWMLQSLMKAVGLDNANQSVDAKQVIGEYLWLVVKKEIYVDSDNKPIYKEGKDGKQYEKVYYNRYKYLAIDKEKGIVPEIKQSDIVKIIVEASEAKAEPIKVAPADEGPIGADSLENTKVEQPKEVDPFAGDDDLPF